MKPTNERSIQALCCAECKTRLKGDYCETCKMVPSLDDVYPAFFCSCGQRLKKDKTNPGQRLCLKCQKIYTA